MYRSYRFNKCIDLIGLNKCAAMNYRNAEHLYALFGEIARLLIRVQKDL